MAKYHNIGSVSSGTMRKEDLIPSFAWELEHQKPLRKYHAHNLRVIKTNMEVKDYYDTEEADWDLETLFEMMEEYAPPYFYFGSHPSNGSDYGYWLGEDFEQDIIDMGGIKVSDLSEIPKGYTGEVLEINDHGNCTLWYKSRNHRMAEMWSIV